MNPDKVTRAVLVVLGILKKRFPNLSTEQATDLTAAIMGEVISILGEPEVKA